MMSSNSPDPVFEITHVTRLHDGVFEVAGRAYERLERHQHLIAIANTLDHTITFRLVQIRLYGRDVTQIDPMHTALLTLEGAEDATLDHATHLFALPDPPHATQRTHNATAP